jgi:hypothetical protein
MEGHEQAKSRLQRYGSSCIHARANLYARKGEAKRMSLTDVLSLSPLHTYEQALAIAMHKLHRLHVENTALKREVRSHVRAHASMCVSVCEAS